MLEARQQVVTLLSRLKKRVDEFNDCGELDMIQQYVQDIRVTQRKLAEIKDQVEPFSCFIFTSL